MAHSEKAGNSKISQKFNSWRQVGVGMKFRSGMAEAPVSGRGGFPQMKCKRSVGGFLIGALLLRLAQAIPLADR